MGNSQQLPSGANAALLEAILATAVDGIITIDPKGAVQSLNRASEQMFDYAAEEVLGRNIKMLMPPV